VPAGEALNVAVVVSLDQRFRRGGGVFVQHLLERFETLLLLAQDVQRGGGRIRTHINSYEWGFVDAREKSARIYCN